MAYPDRAVATPLQAGSDGPARGRTPEAAAASGTSGPFLVKNGHNSNGVPLTSPPDRVALPGSARRTALALLVNVRAMADQFGIERLGFLTLTFREHITDAREARRRFNSLATGVIRPRYGRALSVLERHKSGRIHFHLLVAMSADIRSGVDFGALARRDYRSAGDALRSEWAFWRRTAPAYGFGRTELLPVKSDAEAMGRYVGKYLGKHFSARQEADRGIRLVSYIGERAATSRFSWATPRASAWRDGIRLLVSRLHELSELPEPTGEAAARHFGRSWVYRFRRQIAAYAEDPFAADGEELRQEIDRAWEAVRRSQ